MTDIVERLKMRDMSVGEVSDIYREAAAEITRLRADRDAVIRECLACIDRVYYNDGQPLPYSARKVLNDVHERILALTDK